MKSAYALSCLAGLGVDIGALGCVMLDVEPITHGIPDLWAYHSTNPKLPHVSGIQTKAHLTLLYGLLVTDRAAVDEVMDGWEPSAKMCVSGVTAFRSPLPDEPYSCVVARVDSDSLREAHQRLSMLPHIDTHPEYKPHITLAYVHEDFAFDAVERARRARAIREYWPLIPRGLNYGDVIR